MTDQSSVNAGIALVRVVGQAIREIKEVPSGHLYASLMQYLSLEQYNAVIGALKTAGLVREEYHLLKWIGP